MVTRDDHWLSYGSIAECADVVLEFCCCDACHDSLLSLSSPYGQNVHLAHQLYSYPCGYLGRLWWNALPFIACPLIRKITVTGSVQKRLERPANDLR